MLSWNFAYGSGIDWKRTEVPRSSLTSVPEASCTSTRWSEPVRTVSPGKTGALRPARSDGSTSPLARRMEAPPSA